MAGVTNTKAKGSVHTCEPSFGELRWILSLMPAWVCRVLVSKEKICNLSFCKYYTTELHTVVFLSQNKTKINKPA